MLKVKLLLDKLSSRIIIFLFFFFLPHVRHIQI